MTKYLFLHSAFLLYTLSTVLMKFISKHIRPFSFLFFLLYTVVLGVLFLYAVLWQKALARLPLFVAYASKGVVIIYALIVGYLLFGEIITLKSIIASFAIILGIALVVKS